MDFSLDDDLDDFDMDLGDDLGELGLDEAEDGKADGDDA